jgi:hypothetical protein
VSFNIQFILLTLMFSRSDYTETDDDGSRASESGSDNEQEL